MSNNLRKSASFRAQRPAESVLVLGHHLFSVSRPAESDPAVAWIVQHADELPKYAGYRVGIHPRLGIVAKGKTLAIALRALRRSALTESERAEVLFESVPKNLP